MKTANRLLILTLTYTSVTGVLMKKKYVWLHTIIFADRFCLSSSQHHPNTNPPVCHRTPRCVWTVISGCSLTITRFDCVQSSGRQHGCRASCAGKPGANDLAWCRKICCTASKSPRQYWWEDKTLKHHGSGYVFYCTAAYCPCRKTPEGICLNCVLNYSSVELRTAGGCRGFYRIYLKCFF